MGAVPIASRLLARTARPARAALACLALSLVTDAAERRGSPSAASERPQLCHNANAADTSNVDELAPNGPTGFDLTGRGVRVGIWDVGSVLASHQDLADRVRVLGSVDPSHHATHAAGTILGDGTGSEAARGMAPAATGLWFSADDTAATLAEVGGGLSVSHHAYGPALGWFDNLECDNRPSWVNGSNTDDPLRGKYDQSAADIDAVAFAGDDVVVWSAGNHRRTPLPAGTGHYHYPSCVDVYDDEHAAQDGYDTIGGPAVAKNAIAVGAIRDVSVDPVDPAEVQPLGFSSFGPTDDGRVKPDLVASGFSVYSTFAGADDAYGSLSGTSSSAAVAAGAIALLVEQYRAHNGGIDPRAAVIKALLVQTALDDADLAGPDAETGHGLLDARAAADLVARDAAAASRKRLRVGVLQNSAQVFTTSAEVPTGTALKATLAWLDPPGQPNTAGADDATAALVNDLDLVLVAPDGTTEFLPWSLDAQDRGAPATRSAANRVDPTEVVSVDAADNIWAGAWTLRVSGTLADSAPQAYALASSEPLGAGPVAVLGAPRYLKASVQLGEPVPDLVLPVRNLGSGALAFSIEDTPDWLVAEPTSGEAPADVQLAIDPALLAAGEQRGTLSIASDDPSGARRVTIVLDVTACPADCTGLACSTDPVCGESCGSCGSDELCVRGACVPDPCADVECPPCQICSGGACIPGAEDTACDDGNPCTQDDRCRAGDCEGSDPCDAGAPDGGGATDASAGSSEDAAPGANDGSVEPERMNASGCGCRVLGASRRAGPFAPWLLLGLLAVGFARGRRRSARMRGRSRPA